MPIYLRFEHQKRPCLMMLHNQRWNGPGKSGVLKAMLYDVDAGIAVEGPRPGRSAQNRYAAAKCWLCRGSIDRRQCLDCTIVARKNAIIGC